MSVDPFSMFNANTAAKAQTDAAKTNSATADRALQQQKDIYDQEVARNKPFYDSGVTGVINLNKMVNGGYAMEESPAAKYQLTQGTKSLNRQLSARGLLGSGNASQRLAELSSGIAANDYDKQYSRLLDQVKIGTGASASAGAASQTLSNAIGQNSAAVQQNTTQSGAARAALYSGLSGANAQAMGTGLNAYRSGLFSGGGDGNGALYNDAGGNINNVDFESGGGWGGL